MPVVIKSMNQLGAMNFRGACFLKKKFCHIHLQFQSKSIPEQAGHSQTVLLILINS